MGFAISVSGLKKTYRGGFWLQKFEALRGVDFQVQRKRITGFIGSNGAGKTTTIRCLLGFTKINAGQILFFDGEELSTSVRKRIGYLPEHPNFYDQLTGYEFLKFHGRLSGQNLTQKQIEESLERVRLQGATHRKLREYSKGMLQRIGLTQALIHRPEFLILDEPMSGLDPDGRRLVKDLLRQSAQEGMTLFFSTHLLDDVEDLCQDIVMVAKGQVRYSGELKPILSEKRLEDVFSEFNRGEF